MKLIEDIDTRFRKMAQHSNGIVLDVGFAEHPNPYLKGRQVIGYDLLDSQKPNPNYDRCIKDDFKNIKSHFREGMMDVIYAGEFIEHIENHKEFLETCYGLLAKGGKLIISTPTPYFFKTAFGNTFRMKGKTNNKDHIAVYIPRILNRLAESIGFKTLSVEGATKVYVPYLTWQLIYVYQKE